MSQANAQQYIAAFMDNLNWQEVARRLEWARVAGRGFQGERHGAT
jgi:hypothetical protein